MFDVQGFFINNTELKWYVLQVYVGFEDAVRKNLDLKIQNLSIQDKIPEIFIPTQKVYKLNSKGERVEKLKKLFPGYIYINCVLDKDIGYMIQNTQYISRITGTGDFAVALEDGYVEKMKIRLAEENENLAASTIADYNIGDLVRVIDGPFKEMQGKICGIDTNTSRVNVLLTIFERESNVELDVLEVQKVL
jgi:transcription termination/antitermination protein NusG